MAGTKKSGKPGRQAPVGAKQTGGEWTAGLKQLYNSVVDEPLPDALSALLAKLDDK